MTSFNTTLETMAAASEFWADRLRSMKESAPGVLRTQCELRYSTTDPTEPIGEHCILVNVGDARVRLTAGTATYDSATGQYTRLNSE